jgi:signal transduction histidine kinase
MGHFGLPSGHLPVASYLAVPVVARSGDVIGCLIFGHANPNVFTERSERLIVGIAAQAAIAIDNSRLYEEARRSADERARLLDAERTARAELERVSLVKDEFLATLSHELRTPLNAVLGWSGILLARAEKDSESRRGLETIVRNARAQTQLIEDLLDMNRIVSGKIRLDVQRVDLAPIVETALDSVRPSAEAKSIAVRCTIGPNAGPVFGDPNRLQQIVWNLLTNAVKFTPKGGKIDVIVQRVNSHVEVAVHDSGMGISHEFLPHLFERFRQAAPRRLESMAALASACRSSSSWSSCMGAASRPRAPEAGTARRSSSAFRSGPSAPTKLRRVSIRRPASLPSFAVRKYPSQRRRCSWSTTSPMLASS